MHVTINEDTLVEHGGRSPLLTSKTRNPLTCCIYKVPKKLREGSEDHYAPQVISIGPFHHGIKKYASMEKLKGKTMNTLIKETGKSYQYLFDGISEYEGAVRDCYSEEVEELDRDTYVRMMLMDAAFIVFAYYHDYTDNEKVTQSVADEIKHDLRLLENQLPLFLLRHVYHMLYQDGGSSVTKFMDHKVLARRILPQHLIEKMPQEMNQSLHFLDVLRSCNLIQRPGSASAMDKLSRTQKHTPIRSAKKLREAGVKIKRSKNATFFNTGGYLALTPLELTDTSLTTFRNIMAFEQCHYQDERCVSDYLILMDMLIRDGSEDLLVRKRVVVNNLNDGKDATTVLRDLCKNITYSSYPFGLGLLCAAANKHCDSITGRLRASFNSVTWQVGATTILILTFLQTIFSALTYFNVAFRPV